MGWMDGCVWDGRMSMGWIDMYGMDRCVWDKRMEGCVWD